MLFLLSHQGPLRYNPPEPAVTNGQAAKRGPRAQTRGSTLFFEQKGDDEDGASRETRSRGPLCPLIFHSGRAVLDPCSYYSICVQRFARTCHPRADGDDDPSSSSRDATAASSGDAVPGTYARRCQVSNFASKMEWNPAMRTSVIS
jgi:hypothetical protein